MASNEYPKVLLVTSQAFNPYTGSGITLTNLFRGWPVDRIAMIYADHSYRPDNSVCRNFYLIGDKERKWSWPLSFLMRRQAVPRLGEPAGAKEAAGGGALQAPNVAPGRVDKRLYRLAMSVLGGHELLRRHHVSDQLQDWIESFQPELIYSEFSTLTALRFVREIVSLTGAPLATHTFDDWPWRKYGQGLLASFARPTLSRELEGVSNQLAPGTSSYDKVRGHYQVRSLRQKGLLAPWVGVALRRELGDIFKRAAVRMGICDKMCREYEARYGLPFVPFHNVVEVDVWEKAARKDWSAHTPFRIVHSGNIGARSKMQSLLDICSVVRELHSSGTAIELRIHTLPVKANLYRSILESPAVTVHDPPENEEFAALLAGADLLILPVDFGPERIANYQYSMPTRVPAYMMSGTPILVYGPPEVAAVEYAQQAEWGYVVPRRDLDALREALVLLTTDAESRRELGQRAQELAVQNHDAVKVREAFRRALANAAAHRAP